MMAYLSAGTYRPAITCLLAVAMAGSAAAAATPEDGPAPAEATASAPRPRVVIAIPTPLPLPGQLKPPVAASPAVNSGDPRDRVVRANAAARVQPDRASWLNAIQQYPYTDGALYQVYTAPGQVTDIALEEGEELAGSGPVAAGDTVRWVIGDAVSGTGSGKRVHILVKPTRDDIATNMETRTDGVPHEDSRLVVLSEMTGPMDAVILMETSNEVVHGYAVEDHEALLDAGAGRVDLSWVDVPHLERSGIGTSPARVDLRYALVTYKDGMFDGSIHNSRAEADAALEEWSEEHNAFVVDHNNSIAVCAVSPILVPRPGLGGQ